MQPLKHNSLGNADGLSISNNLSMLKIYLLSNTDIDIYMPVETDIPIDPLSLKVSHISVTTFLS